VPKPASLKADAQWLSQSDAAAYLGVTMSLLGHWMRGGKIKTIRHPIHPKKKAIPYSEIQRILGVGNEIIVHYDGRTYPHQVFLFYLAVSYGFRIKIWKDYLEALGFHVPPDHELKAIAEATAKTAPAGVQRLMRRFKPYEGAKGYDGWIDRLGFTEPLEDLFEFLPMIILANDRAREIVEICGAAGMKPVVVCNAVRRVSDIAIDPSMVKNYLWMFHYVRQMSTKDWDLYINDEYVRDIEQATAREECIDNPLGVYKHLKINEGVEAGDQLEDMVWNLKHKFDQLIDSQGIEGRNFALGAAKVINGTISNIIKLKQLMAEESGAISAKRLEIEGVGAGGMNPVNIAELTMKDEAPTFEELMAQGKQAVEEEKAG